jgi:hypothetical protein
LTPLDGDAVWEPTRKIGRRAMKHETNWKTNPPIDALKDVVIMIRGGAVAMI